MQMDYLDNGHYIISAKDAKRLNNGYLPECGREALVEHDNKTWWLKSIHTQGRQVWTIRNGGGWKLIDGVAVLGR